MAAGTHERAETTRRNVVTRFLLLNWGILLILGAWEGWVVANDFNPIVMPSPQGVAVDMVSNPGVYIENTSVTLFVALVGLAGGLAVGTGLAILTWFSPLMSGIVSPTAVLFSSVPVVSMIPIIARILGYLIAVTKQEFLTERAFGTSVIATAVSVAVFLATSILERRIRARFT